MSNAIIPFNELQQIGKALAASRYFQDANNEAQAIVKVLAGQEMGIGPFAAMTGIHIIKGKPVLGANVIATLIKNDPRYNYRVAEHTDKVCSIDFYENGEKIGNSTITIDELQKAGSQNLQKYPKNMLFARAISNGAKWHTPGIFGGSPVYTPDEFGLEVDEEGDVLEGVVSDPAPAEESYNTLLDEFYQVGGDKYGEAWQEKSRQLASAVTKGMTEDPADLNNEQLNKLISGMLAA